MIMDFGFNVLYFSELVIKVYLTSWGFYLCGPDRDWNRFDLIIIFLGSADNILNLSYLVRGITPGNSPSFILVRIVRLTRITRVVRLMHMPMFKELLHML